MKEFVDRIIQGDCLQCLSKIPDGTTQITWADPPFNLDKKYTSYNDKRAEKDYITWCEEWISELVRITNDTGSIFIHNIPKWLTYYATYLNTCYPCEFKHWISWDAPSGSSSKKNSLQPCHYGILYYCKNLATNKFYKLRHPHKRCRSCDYLLKDYGGKKEDIHWFGPLVSDAWTDIHRVKHNIYKASHPCQLPIHLLERIILMCSDEGDLVVDPFMGSGTTAIAAKRLGRRFLGFDISEDYVKAANDKLSGVVESKVGDVFVSKFPKDSVLTAREVDMAKLETYYVIPKTRSDINSTRIFLK